LKRLFYIIICLILHVHLVQSQVFIRNPDDVTGVWVSSNGAMKIKIEREKDKLQYNGRILWLRDSTDPKTGLPRTDKFNPVFEKQYLPIVGLYYLKGFRYNPKKQAWNYGKIYDPAIGKEYEGILRLIDRNTLLIREYVYFTFLGANRTWKRIS
jgi:uncharacterized protein (DUF2147 family)